MYEGLLVSQDRRHLFVTLIYIYIYIYKSNTACKCNAFPFLSFYSILYVSVRTLCAFIIYVKSYIIQRKNVHLWGDSLKDYIFSFFSSWIINQLFIPLENFAGKNSWCLGLDRLSLETFFIGSRIHERTILLEFLGTILRVLSLQVFVYNDFNTQTIFKSLLFRGGGGGLKYVCIM
jgi:hypothetical protein